MFTRQKQPEKEWFDIEADRLAREADSVLGQVYRWKRIADRRAGDYRQTALDEVRYWRARHSTLLSRIQRLRDRTPI